MLALCAGSVSVSAQQTIILSKPKEVDSDKANSFLNKSGSLHADDYKAPQSFFNIAPDLPLPRPSYQPWDSSAIETANKQKNWGLLTPEQIFGVQKPEDLLGVKPQDGKDKLSLEDQFLLRQRKSSGGMATNGGAGSLFMRDDSNPFLKRMDRNNPNAWQPGYDGSPNSSQFDSSQPDSYRSLKRLFGNANPGDVYAPGNQPQNSMWTSGFTQPTQPKATQEQLDSMERFRALMQSAPAQDSTAQIPSYNAAKPSSSSFFDQPPSFNPAGRSYTALESDITRPKGLTPLPGVTGPVSKPDNNIRPDWKAKLPPWMSSGPQAYNPSWHY
jgi:hypothetical protein